MKRFWLLFAVLLITAACGAEESVPAETAPGSEGTGAASESVVADEDEDGDDVLGIPGSHVGAVVAAMGELGFDPPEFADYYQYQAGDTYDESGVPGVRLGYNLLYYAEDDTVAELYCTAENTGGLDEDAFLAAATAYFLDCAASLDCDDRYPDEAGAWIAATLPNQTEDAVTQEFGLLNHHLRRTVSEEGKLEELVLILRHYQEWERCNSID